MPPWPTPQDDPRLAGFEQAPEPAFVTEGARHLVVAANAAARDLLGGAAVGSELVATLPGLGSEQLEQWSWVLQSEAPLDTSLRLPARDSAAQFDLHLEVWRDRAGDPAGVLARLRPEASSPGDLAAQLQDAVLLDELPVVPGVDLAATSVLADRADQARGDRGPAGDWFDAVPTPTGALALVVGDVVGCGAAAVAEMATLRAVLRERLGAGCGLADALGAVDTLARGLREAVTSTVVVALLDPATGELTYCTAGHPAPLVIDPNGGARALPASGADALGLQDTVSFPTLSHVLEPGQLLLLYSDGVGKRAGSDIAQGVGELAGSAHATFARLGGGHGIRGTADQMCRRIVDDLAGPDGNNDDIVLLAAERMPVSTAVELVLPAEVPTVREVRSRLREWLTDLRAGDLDVAAVLHAVGELVSNVVEHAYAARPSGDDDLRVGASHSAAGEVVVTVADRGHWRAGHSPGRGRGLIMARGLVDHLEVERRGEGTTATVRHRLARPVAVFRGRPHRPMADDALRTEAAGPGRIAVGGALDETSVEELRAQLLQRTRGGTVPLVVDLSRVSHLGSIAVRTLAEALTWSRDGTGVTLVAPPGTPARQVLTLVGLECADA